MVMDTAAPGGAAPDLSPAWAGLLNLHPDGVIVVSRLRGVEFMNPAAERMLGMDLTTLRRVGLGSPTWQAHRPDGRRLRHRDFPILRALRTGHAVRDAEVEFRHLDDRCVVLSVNAAPFDTADGDTVVIASIRDITVERRAERRRASAWNLVRALGASLDMDATVATVASMALPGLADVAIVHLLEAGRLRLAACRHRDPDRQSLLDEWCGRFPATEAGMSPAWSVVRSGEPLLLPQLGESVRPRHLGGDEGDLLARLDLSTALCVPMRARGETLGALSFLRAAPPYDSGDRAFAEELAAHAALAVDNARLYQAAQAAREDAERGRREAAEVLESITDGFFAVDRGWRFTYVNRRAEALLGRSRGELVGQAVVEDFAQVMGGEALAAMRATMADRRQRTTESFAPTPRVWVLAQVYPTERGLSVYFRDITQRKEAEQKEHLLTDTGLALASSLGWDETVRNAAELAVPTFADLCTIDLLVGEEVVCVASAVADPERGAALEEIRRRWPPRLGDALANVRAIEHGEATFLPEVDLQDLMRTNADPAFQRLVQRVAPESIIALPLQARGERIGAILFGYVGSGRRYHGRDLRVAEELARRVALAIDNARLLRDAMASDRAKSDFISVMSHEFRTPLTAIVGYAELLGVGVVGTLNERQHQHLARILSGAWHMTHLVDEVLTYSRMEAGRETVDARALDAGDLLQKAVELVRPVIEGKGLHLRLEVPEATVPLRTDPHKLRQVLINLLGNAGKFTSQGSVTARLVELDAGVRFEVEDTGIGIAPEHVERVFESFWQVDQGTTRAVGGVGLGLTIARRLTELLGGELALRSQAGQGSCFTVTLPPDVPLTPGLLSTS